MPDRRPKPDRPDPIAGETPREAPRHPASPAATEESRPAATDLPGKATPLENSLRELIQSLPRRPGSSGPGAKASAAGAIPGVAPPTVDDRPAVARPSKPNEDGPANDAAPLGADRLLREGTPPGPDQAAHRGPRVEDRDGQAVGIPTTGPLAGASLGDPTIPPGPSHLRESIDDPESPGRRDEPGGIDAPASVGASNRNAVGFAASLVVAAGEPRGNDAQETPLAGGPSTAITIPIAAPSPAPAGATIEIGPVGLAARRDEGFDGAAIAPVAATAWGGSSEDSFGGAQGAGPAPGDGAIGVDLGPTNALLGQILDELRRRQQPAPIASARSVYPER